ncbi:hypothetical protein AB0L99_44490 [Streptomyces sp. NPDC051954]|uniref:hypothetical protein n=1 Tax=unclassified Streptomyces TaxID=2593676 RepID=UPI003429DCE2
MYVLARTTIEDHEALVPYSEAEQRAGRAMRDDGVLIVSYRRGKDASDVALILEVADFNEARRQLERLPLVANKVVAFELEEIFHLKVG